MRTPNEEERAELDSISDATLALREKNQQLKSLKSIDLEGSKQTVIVIKNGKTTISVLSTSANPPKKEVEITGVSFGSSAISQIIAQIESEVASEEQDLLERASIINQQLKSE